MTPRAARGSAARTIPRSAIAAAAFGLVGGSLAWMITSAQTDASTIISNGARADLVAACVLGLCTGALVLLGRARHRREGLWNAIATGAIVGGASALVGATLTNWIGQSDSATTFAIARMVACASIAACTSAGLSLIAAARSRTLALESAAIGALGGAVGGAVATLPGPTELWSALAMAWTGATIGFAAVGPSLWRAPVLVQVLPARSERRNMWTLHERTVERGSAMVLAEARITCDDDAVTVHPPPSGAVLDGYPVYRSMPLQRDGMLAVGRARFRLTLTKPT